MLTAAAAELGVFFSALSLVAAVRLVYEGHKNSTAGIYRMAMAMSIFLLVAYLILTYLFLSDDFSVSYVVNNSNTNLAWWYKISGVWGAHEGSILLWVVILMGWIVIAERNSRNMPYPFRGTMFSVLALVALGFLSFVIFSSNPFVRTFTPFEQGQDLNPLLQDPGLIFHPPLLYLGYIGMAVPFAFSMAMILHARKATTAELTFLRFFVLLSFSFLSLGIALGSFWAYYELGWGGWWFWDPVENASLMPWLVSIALIHALGVAIKRSTMMVWVYALSTLGFCLSVLGTFLVRSGIIVSVHSFASDPDRGIFILMLLSLLCIPSFSLLVFRSSLIEKTPVQNNTLFSRYVWMQLGIVVVLTLLFVVALGTLYPLVIELLQIGKISVGPPYFNSVFVPIAIPLLVLAAIAPTLRWHDDKVARIAKPLLLSLGIAVIFSGVLFFTTTHYVYSALGATGGFFR